MTLIPGIFYLLTMTLITETEFVKTACNPISAKQVSKSI